jgi:ribokinase
MARHPRPGETVMSGDVEQRFGGKGANQAVAAALAGAESVFVGRVGDDAPGSAYRERLAEFGVDTSRLRTVAGAPTGTAVIYNDSDGENMIVVAPGANHRIGQADLADLDDLAPDDILLMPLELPHDVVAAATRLAAGRGTRVVLNLAPFAELPPDVLAACDPVIVNEHEGAQLDETGVAVPSRLTTAGLDGSRWVSADTVLEAAAVPVTPVDTTGAGDAYCGTLAARLCLGDDPAAAMKAASAAAARCVEHAGAQPALP